MPAEFQKVLDNLLMEFPQANALIDEILIASKETKVEHIALVEKVLKKLDVSNVSLKLRKYQFAKTEFAKNRAISRKTQAVEVLKTQNLESN